MASTKEEKEPLRKDTITLYAVTDWIIKPFTAKATSSYVELVAGGAQRPKWFVSHWANAEDRIRASNSPAV